MLLAVPRRRWRDSCALSRDPKNQSSRGGDRHPPLDPRAHRDHRARRDPLPAAVAATLTVAVVAATVAATATATLTVTVTLTLTLTATLTVALTLTVATTLTLTLTLTLTAPAWSCRRPRAPASFELSAVRQPGPRADRGPDESLAR